MVVCAVYGCKSRSGKKYNSPHIRFFTFPSVNSRTEKEYYELILQRRSLWLSRIARKDLTFYDSKVAYARVCSKHFIKGAPSMLKDTSDPDWAPSINLGHDFFKHENKVDKKKKNSSTSQDITEDYTSDMKDADEDEENISATNESESMDEESMTSNENSHRHGQDRLKYFIFRSNNSNDESHTVTHEEALTCAETLLRYMNDQDNVEDGDRFLMQNYIWKIKEKILRE